MRGAVLEMKGVSHRGPRALRQGVDLLERIGAAPVGQLLPVDLVPIEDWAIDARELRLAVDREAARPAMIGLRATSVRILRVLVASDVSIIMKVQPIATKRSTFTPELTRSTKTSPTPPFMPREPSLVT